MSETQAARETAQDVFRLLLDAYRAERKGLIDEDESALSSELIPAYRELVQEIKDWAARYEAAQKREGQS